MYKGILRPVLFLFKPEAIHNLIVSVIGFLLGCPLIKRVISHAYSVQETKLKRVVFGLEFDNPVGLAAGFDKDARIFNQFAAFGFSFIEVGTLTPEGQPGNSRPRSFRLPRDRALINRMGFNNQGIEKAAERLEKRNGSIIVGGNIGKNTDTKNEDAVKDYARCFKALYNLVDYIVVNISCPNIRNLSELQDRKQLAVILDTLTSIRSGMDSHKPLLIKISPDMNDRQIDDVLDLIRKFSLDGIVATNTTITRDNLNTDPRKIQKIGEGGLSGKPIRDRSTEIIRYIYRKTGGNLPIIGVGGIMSAADAIEKIKAGASLVQVYTGFIYEGPGLVKRINKALLEI